MQTRLADNTRALDRITRLDGYTGCTAAQLDGVRAWLYHQARQVA